MRQEALGPKDLLDRQAAMESTEPQESLDQRDPTASLEHLDRMESPVSPDIPAKTDNPARRVSARSTVRSTEESSSRTERVARLCTALFINAHTATAIKSFTKTRFVDKYVEQQSSLSNSHLLSRFPDVCWPKGWFFLLLSQPLRQVLGNFNTDQIVRR